MGKWRQHTKASPSDGETPSQRLGLRGVVAAALATLGFATLGFGWAAVAESPLGFIQARKGEVDAVWKQPSTERHNALVSLLKAHVAFDEFARRSLGYQWRELTADQQAIYQDELQKLLERAYIQQLAQKPPHYRLSWEGELVQGTRAIVSLVIRHEDTETEVEFDLQSHKDSWEIVDVSYDGLSAASGYQKSHSKILREKGFDALILHIQTHPDDLSHGPL